MSAVNPPAPLDINENVGLEWKRWLKQYEWYSLAKGLKNEPADIQVANFMCAIGNKAVQLYDTFGLSETETDVQVIIKKFNDVFLPKGNVIYERYMFNRMQQTNNELFDEFLNKVQTQALKCEFGASKDSLIIDKLVIGVRNSSIREKLLSELDLDLPKAINICRANEQATNQLRKDNVNDNPVLRWPCKRCGEKHALRNCPAHNKECQKCGNKGHLAKFCELKYVGVVNAAPASNPHATKQKEVPKNKNKNKKENKTNQ